MTSGNRHLLKPHALRRGARLAVVAPASPFDRAGFERGVDELHNLGFETVFDETVFARRGYVAGDAELRAGAIHRAWRDPSVAAVVAARGGYGSVQLLPLLDLELAREARKPFIGYSDVTSILSVLSCQAHLVCFHGPTVEGRLGRGADGYDRESFVRALTSLEPTRELAAPGLVALNSGETSGPLFGGTLTQLAASLGTPFAFDPPPGHVLFLEDVGERPYRLDRMVTQLALSGIIGRASAVILGEFVRCDEPGGLPSARQVLADLFRDFPGPVVAGFPSGHTAGPSVTLPLGVRVRVRAGDTPGVVIEEAAVE